MTVDAPRSAEVDEVPAGPGIDRRLTLVLAVAAGLSAANLYYAQPLLASIAAELGTSEGTTGLIVTTAQIGYALGLALVVPIGDLIDRRRITSTLLGVATLTLIASAAAPNLAFLAVALLLVGLGSATAQVLVPLAAQLAGDGERGRVVGTVMTGLLLGILLARTVAGAVSGLVGWRGTFVFAAVAVAALAVVLRRELPEVPPVSAEPYPRLLRSVLTLLRDEPELRRSALLGGLSFGTFSLFWTTIAYHLAAPPFDYGDALIGVVGLAGAAGALLASVAGRLADRGLAFPGRRVLSVVLTASFGILWVGRHSIVGILVGILVLDIAVQGVQVLNQSVIYDLAPRARSRINAAYMTIYFIGASAGSAAGAFAHERSGWAGAVGLGAALAALSLLVSLPGRLGSRGGDGDEAAGASGGVPTDATGTGPGTAIPS